METLSVAAFAPKVFMHTMHMGMCLTLTKKANA
jgi:hypothetical protein